MITALIICACGGVAVIVWAGSILIKRGRVAAVRHECTSCDYDTVTMIDDASYKNGKGAVK